MKKIIILLVTGFSVLGYKYITKTKFDCVSLDPSFIENEFDFELPELLNRFSISYNKKSKIYTLINQTLSDINFKLTDLHYITKSDIACVTKNIPKFKQKSCIKFEDPLLNKEYSFKIKSISRGSYTFSGIYDTATLLSIYSTLNRTTKKNIELTDYYARQVKCPLKFKPKFKKGDCISNLGMIEHVDTHAGTYSIRLNKEVSQSRSIASEPQDAFDELKLKQRKNLESELYFNKQYLFNKSKCIN